MTAPQVTSRVPEVGEAPGTVTPSDSPERLVGWGDRFPNRWDDPEGTYRVLYAATTRTGAFIESLRDFRVAPGLQEKLDAIGAPDAVPPGVVPRKWLENRYIGPAIVTGAFADVQHHEWISYFQGELSSRFGEWGLKEIDGAVLRSTATRAVTMAASRLVYVASLADAASGPRFAGIRYESRFGNDIECWAVFEYSQVGVPFSHLSADRLTGDDEDLLAACRVLGIRLQESPPPARLGASDSAEPQWWSP